MAELFEQGALGLGVARVEFPQLGVEQVIEEERAVSGAIGRRDFQVKAALPLGILAGRKRPTDGLGVAEDSGMDGFVFSGDRYGFDLLWSCGLRQSSAIFDGRNDCLESFYIVPKVGRCRNWRSLCRSRIMC